jgi:hypothetical protein
MCPADEVSEWKGKALEKQISERPSKSTLQHLLTSTLSRTVQGDSRIKFLQPRVNVMITIFCRFSPIFGENIKFTAFFLKNNVMIQILEKLAVLCTINALFRPIVWRKYFKSHNIGPWVAKLGKINSLPVVATYQFPLIF